VGRAEAPGRPILYSTTTEFLQYFGLNSLADLPALNLEASPQPHAEEIQILKG
jgi:segregation and condensation protein B